MTAAQLWQGKTPIRALARAHPWNRMLETLKCRAIAESAEAEQPLNEAPDAEADG